MSSGQRQRWPPGPRLNGDQLTIRILNGGTNMPPFADVLTPQEVADLVAFLESRQ